jgi:hypothetical protein
VMARVKNIGARTGEFEVVLRIDGQVEDLAAVELKPDKWSWVRFTVLRQTSGSYEVSVGQLAGQLIVR